MRMNWNKQKLMGNNAENVVRYLINSMPDWKCCEFGVETHIKDIKDMVREESNPITTKIRKMPDFVAFNKKTKETFFVEVKYSSSLFGNNYLFGYLENYNEYWKGTKLIIVRPNEPLFVYIDLEKINDSMRKMKQIEGKWKASWNFKGIEQGIKYLFPDLKDEDIKFTHSSIPKHI